MWQLYSTLTGNVIGESKHKNDLMESVKQAKQRGCNSLAVRKEVKQ